MITRVAGAALLMAVAPVFAQGLLLDAGVPVLDQGWPMQVGDISAPHVVDWNQDGAKDLLVANSSCGEIVVFLNVGPDHAPVFQGSQALYSGGEPIVTSYG